MKKLASCLAFVGVLMLTGGGTAGAKPPALASLAATVFCAAPGTTGSALTARAYRSGPTVSGITPTSAPNDLDATVTITGAGFEAVMSGTVVLTPPTVFLGSKALTNVTFVDGTTLTATVPWGLDAGSYPLRVVDPDGGSGSLASAFAVTQAIGQWNAGDLYGGDISQILLKPGAPDTVYALALGVIGLFRSADAGEHWAMVSDKVWANNNKFAIDPLHPDWLYSYAPNGLMRSQDDGATWTTLTPNKWPDPAASDVMSPQVYVSPYESLPDHPQALFVSSSAGYGVPTGTSAQGLIKSVDGGVTWTIVPSLEGIPVQDVTFDPSNHAHMVAVTSDVKVYESNDWGVSWSPVSTNLPAGLTTLGLGGSIMYNPYKAGEAWLVSQAPHPGGGIFKSTDATLTSWQDVSAWSGSGYTVSFTSADSVYCWRHHSIDGGTTWLDAPFGPVTMNGDTAFVFDPRDPQTAYISDSSVGIRKTTDGGTTWQNKITGLTALRCFSMAVSPADPLRVYAIFDGPPGVYRSDDGTNHWTYLQLPGIANVRQVVADPLDPQRVYVGADSGLYVSTDGGSTWTSEGWSGLPSPPPGLFVTLAADPDPAHAGTLLASFGGGTYGIGPGWLYRSTDYGASWTPVTVDVGASVQWIHCIAFDPQTPGTVYLTTTGVYESTDHGATWQRIDDPQQPDMTTAYDITIATHPHRMLLVGVAGLPYRSLDGGTTWRRTQNWPGPSGYLFADGDSTRLYGGSPTGLWSSSDAGDSWERAAGTLGQVQTTVVASARVDGHTILYAATNGGGTTTAGKADRAVQRTSATADTLVGAGIYRFVQVPTPTMTLKLTGLKKGVLKLGKRVTATGKATPTILAHSKIALVLQKKKGARWVKVRTVQQTISAVCVYSWKYKPAGKGTYRVQATIVKAATHAAATTRWIGFKVK